MVDNQKKRKLPTGATTLSAKKRKKNQTTKKAGQKTVAKTKKVLDANALPWKTVDIPEMFDDAEGFFGLEEVTGVEVVRNGNTVKFVSMLPSRCYCQEIFFFSANVLRAGCRRRPLRR